MFWAELALAYAAGVLSVLVAALAGASVLRRRMAPKGRTVTAPGGIPMRRDS